MKSKQQSNLKRSMKSILRIVVAPLLIWMGLASAAFADEASALRSIGMLQLSTASTSTFYISTDSGWGASGCPSATWAYFYSDLPNAKELFALLMFAKQMGKQVQLVGNCTSSSYFRIFQVNVMS